MAALSGLYGEGVFEFLHPRLQILDFAPLLFDEEVFNPVQARPYLAKLLVHLPPSFGYVLFAGHGALNHPGQACNGSDVLHHMYPSITEC
jgi:hypothetical protein